jgi:hypothetical protein
VERARTLDDEERTADPMNVAQALLDLAAMPKGERPLRTVVAGASGALLDGLNGTQRTVQRTFMRAIGQSDRLPEATSATMEARFAVTHAS